MKTSLEVQTEERKDEVTPVPALKIRACPWVHRGVAAPSQWAGDGQGWVSWDRGRGRDVGKTAAGGRPAGNIIKPATAPTS
ncbi:hypothetical protein E2C01_016060 [Portunus trituberculatus]|uniref:Uncharacterized protein n=1 Tax=Portunus trituberculatus TaxID=210409 RepID=A0A5B7DQ21_PORTR|nr:hypothetical protein [Portunus trituberculatus]